MRLDNSLRAACFCARVTAVALGLASIGSTISVAAPEAAALGPAVTVGEPVNGYVGTLTASPRHAPAGVPVTLAADGLPPDQEFELVWVTATGTWKVTDTEYHGREFNPVAYRIAKVRSDSAGHLAADFIAPEDYGFLHDIVLQQGSR